MPNRASDSEPRPIVLGVDADPVTRSLVALYLEPQGYEVRIAARVEEVLRDAACGAEALFLFSERAWAGASAEERRRLREALEHAHVVLVLEPGSPGVGQAWPAVRDRLHKPIRAEALLAVLRAGTGGVAPGKGGSLGESASGDDLLAGLRELIAEMEMEPAMVGELMGSFLNRMPAYLKELRETLAAGEWKRLDEVAHAMKGMCGNLRFGGLVALSDRLRAAARRRDAPAAGAALEALEREQGRIGAAVREAHLEGP